VLWCPPAIGGVANNLMGVDLTPWDVDVWNIQDWRRDTS
jgi:peptide/nickel transport system substrate-binding protein